MLGLASVASAAPSQTIVYSSSVVFYIDGVVAGTTGVSLVQVIANTNQPLQFGEGNTAPVTFDEFSVYDSATGAAPRKSPSRADLS